MGDIWKKAWESGISDSLSLYYVLPQIFNQEKKVAKHLNFFGNWTASESANSFNKLSNVLDNMTGLKKYGQDQELGWFLPSEEESTVI